MARRWPNTETPEMWQEWTTTEPIAESRIEKLVRDIVQVYQEAYYAQRKSEADQVVAARAQEEVATRLATIEASLVAQQIA